MIGGNAVVRNKDGLIRTDIKDENGVIVDTKYLNDTEYQIERLRQQEMFLQKQRQELELAAMNGGQSAV